MAVHIDMSFCFLGMLLLKKDDLVQYASWHDVTWRDGQGNHDFYKDHIHFV